MKVRSAFRSLKSRFSERLATVPLLFVVGALVLSQVTLAVDRDLSDDTLPRILETTVDSADSILSTIAGGLISAVTLLLSLVLLTVQLASSQFSPRTVRDWIGDRTQQRTIGVVLGTVVFCLMALRETKSAGEDFRFAPHVSVLVAVALAVISLVAVVRSVDHLSNSMRIGSVARGLARETQAAVRSLRNHLSLGSPPPQQAVTATPSPQAMPGRALCLPRAGWMQRIDLAELAANLEPGDEVSVVVEPGNFVYANQPLAWVRGSFDPTDGQAVDDLAAAGFQVGDTRVVDDDVSYGLLQMSDIALRALSPGVNDPNTACDVVVHVGAVLLEIWACEPFADRVNIADVTIELMAKTHGDYLESALAQILRYGGNEFALLATVKRTLETIRSEVERRQLPGPIEPLTEMLELIQEMVAASDLSAADQKKLVATDR